MDIGGNKRFTNGHEVVASARGADTIDWSCFRVLLVVEGTFANAVEELLGREAVVDAQEIVLGKRELVDKFRNMALSGKGFARFPSADGFF